MASSVSTLPRGPSGAGARGGSRTSAATAPAITPVTAASAQTVSRQPKASTAAVSGSEAAMLPRLPIPIVIPASVPKAAGLKLRAKMK